jgi:hypothetical protein
MNLFLVVYDRASHKLVSVDAFGVDYERAAETRAKAQRAAITAGDGEHEIVLLAADSLDVLKRTHSRYFFNGIQLMDQVKVAVEAAA